MKTVLPEIARQAVIDYTETLDPSIIPGSMQPNEKAIAAMTKALERVLAPVVALRDEWRNEGPDCTHALCESEHNSGCGASSCFAKEIDEQVFGIKYD